MSYDPCAENSSFMFCHTTPSSRSDNSSLMAIAQQLLQTQHQPLLPSFDHERLTGCNGTPDNPCQLTAQPAWRAGSWANPSCSNSFSLVTMPRSCCSDVYEDFSSPSTPAYILEPTSVLDLSSPSLDSMHSPLNLTDQRFQDFEQCLHEDIYLADNRPAIKRLHLSTGVGQRLAKSLPRDRATDGNALYEPGEIMTETKTTTPASLYCVDDLDQAENFEEKVSLDHDQLVLGEGSSEWMDCLMNDLHAGMEDVGLASCFGSNTGESTQNSEMISSYPFSSTEDCNWIREDFSFGASSGHRAPSTSLMPEDLPSTSSSDRPLLQFPTINSTSAALMHPHQAHYPSAFSPLPYLCMPHSFAHPAHSLDRRDTVASILTKAGLLGVRLREKGGDQSLIMLQLLINCLANLDAEKRTGKAALMLDHGTTSAVMNLRQLSSPYGDPLQRLAFHCTDALAARLSSDPQANSSSRIKPVSLEDKVMTFRTFNEACPYIKFAHLTANQAILDAAKIADRVHIIDCGIAQGVQWASLLQAFATRQENGVSLRPKIRITGIASPITGKNPCNRLVATGNRLTEFAKLLNLQFEFSPVCSRMEDIDASLLRIEPGEVLVVNFMFQLHHLLRYPAPQHLMNILNLVRSLDPAVITVAEYECSVSAAPLETRFLNDFCFYAALFDSLDEAIDRKDPERAKVENFFFGKEIKHMMAPESTSWKERQVSSENWKSLMEKACFRSSPLCFYSTNQASMLLWHYSEKYSLAEGPGCLSLGWLDNPVITVSAWRC